MLKRQRREYQLILLGGDLVSILLAHIVAVVIRFGPVHTWYESFKTVTVLGCLLTVTALYVADQYNPKQNIRDARPGLLIFASVALAETILALTFYLFPRWKLGRGIFLLVFLVGAVLILAWRLIWFRFHRTVARIPRIGLIGDCPAIDEVRRLAEGHSFQVITVEPAEPCASGTGGASLGWSLPNRHRSAGNDSSGPPLEVIVCPSLAHASEHLTRDLIMARFSGIVVYDVAGFVESIENKLPLDHMEENWFLSADGFRFFEGNLTSRLKRLCDLILAILVVGCMAPFLPFIALGIKLSSSGPVLYLQEREGLDGRSFNLIKFRTMVVTSELESPVWASQGDPRVFPFGRFLRLFHLDEIPQLINVIRGEMSFVGPRPERPAFVEELKRHIPFYHLRDTVLPGLTGWAQVNYPYGASVEDALEKLKYDLYYIRHASLLFDLLIVLKTIRIVLTRQGSR